MKKFELATYHRGGSFAEYCVTDYKSCIPLADDISLEQAASFYVNPLTAIGMVDRMIQLNAKACIITAAASQIGRMLIKLCQMKGITPICTVRRPEQAAMLEQEMKCKFVVNTSAADLPKQLGKICMTLKPSVCLECISGESTGDMLEYLTFGGTLILYGLLSERPAGNIDTIGFIGKNLTIESYLLTNEIAKMPLSKYAEMVLKAEPLYRTALATTVNARFGLHQITEAIAFYQQNQTAGKILLQPELTRKAKL